MCHKLFNNMTHLRLITSQTTDQRADQLRDKGDRWAWHTLFPRTHAAPRGAKQLTSMDARALPTFPPAPHIPNITSSIASSIASSTRIALSMASSATHYSESVALFRVSHRIFSMVASTLRMRLTLIG